MESSLPFSSQAFGIKGARYAYKKQTKSSRHTKDKPQNVAKIKTQIYAIKEKKKMKNQIDATQDRANFQAAKQIALSIAPNCRRRASAESENPFYGCNFNGKCYVIWKPEDSVYTNLTPDGKMQSDNYIYHFSEVTND